MTTLTAPIQPSHAIGIAKTLYMGMCRADVARSAINLEWTQKYVDGQMPGQTQKDVDMVATALHILCAKKTK